ncbi:MAG: DUF2066 domain-containing protein [Proteobacteria bacterium]|nr:DUF2066 domain-containing protein [Pseudomonadota bacterium]
MFNLKTKIFVFISLFLLINPLAIASNAALYDVDVLVVDESADTRWRVFKEGLDEVFIRISGDSIVMDKLKRPPASRYIKQYSYDPVENPTTDEGGRVLGHRLKIQYNGSSMEKYLRDNGYPVWGEHRAEVIVWLAIRDGRNEYVLKDADKSLIKTSAEEALHRRGIPERWPLYDHKDRKKLKVADIRGGFKDPVTAASKRYGRGPSLTGSLIWNGKEWQSSWSLLMGSSNRHWSIEGADYNQLINKAVDQAADAMGLVFAIHGTGKNQQLATVQLEVQAVNSITKYRKLENYLRELSAVEAAVPLKVDGQNAIFEITLRSSEDDLLNLINNDAELVKAMPLKPQVEEPVQPEGDQAVEQDVQATSDQAENVVTNAAPESNEIDNLPGPQPDKQPEVQSAQTTIYHYKLVH